MATIKLANIAIIQENILQFKPFKERKQLLRRRKKNCLLDKPETTPPNPYQGPHFFNLNHRPLHQIYAKVSYH